MRGRVHEWVRRGGGFENGFFFLHPAFGGHAKRKAF